jgi:monoamine oxidase
MNPRLEALLKRLGLRSFEQYQSGAFSLEQADGHIIRQAMTWAQQPASQRVEGGMQSVVEVLSQQLSSRVHLKTATRLTAMTMHAHAIELQFEDQAGVWTQLASEVVVTIPPRLLAQDIQFAPQWPASMQQRMRDTPTWMAQHAKFVAVYPTAFWREQGWSGTAISQRGPISEIHDASDVSGQHAALFGFIGANATYRAGIGEAALRNQILKQLSHIFGDQAAAPLLLHLQDWSQQAFTASATDRYPLAMHPLYHNAEVPDEWASRLWLAGTERSGEHGGYLEGALDAAERAVAQLLQQKMAKRV